MHTYTYTCTHTYTHARTHAHVHIFGGPLKGATIANFFAPLKRGQYRQLFSFTCALSRFRIESRRFDFAHLHTHTHAHIHMHTYTYTCTHTYTHARTHAHVHIFWGPLTGATIANFFAPLKKGQLSPILFVHLRTKPISHRKSKI